MPRRCHACHMKRGYGTFETSKRTAANCCATSSKHTLNPQIRIREKPAFGDTVTIQPSLLYNDIAVTAASNKPSPNSSSEKSLLSTRGVIENSHLVYHLHMLYLSTILSICLQVVWGKIGEVQAYLTFNFCCFHPTSSKKYQYVCFHEALSSLFFSFTHRAVY